MKTSIGAKFCLKYRNHQTNIKNYNILLFLPFIILDKIYTCSFLYKKGYRKDK